MKRVLGLILVGSVFSMGLGCSGASNVEAPTTNEDASKRDAAYKDYEKKMQEAMNKGREDAAAGQSGPPGYGN